MRIRRSLSGKAIVHGIPDRNLRKVRAKTTFSPTPDLVISFDGGTQQVIWTEATLIKRPNSAKSIAGMPMMLIGPSGKARHEFANLLKLHWVGEN
jgi:hypothetical protein